LLDAAEESLNAKGAGDVHEGAAKMRQNLGGRVVDTITQWLQDMAGDAGKRALIDGEPGK
jgi:hypothetical protein